MIFAAILVYAVERIFLACTALVGLALLLGQMFPTDELALDTHHARQRDIYLLDLHHNITYRLTKDPGDHQTPVWSPDGQQIAYISVSGTNQTIMVAGANGHNLRRVFTSRSGYTGSISLAWSPDNQQLAFTALLDGRQVVYVVRVTPDASGSETPRQITSNTDNAFSPTWSPDGTLLAFSWSPVSNQEIFVATLVDFPLPIQTIGHLKQITHTSALDTTPAWSPDGNYIAFVSNRDKNNEIYVMSPDGNNTRRLTYDSANDIAPAWTPDSLRVLFTSNRSGDWEVYTVDAACDTDAGCVSTLLQVTYNRDQGDKLRADWRPPTHYLVLP